MNRLIDRTTDHLCDGLARDIAYFAAQGRSYYRCDEGCRPITVQYAQFSMICAECRRECLDDSDVADEPCVYCGEVLAAAGPVLPEPCYAEVDPESAEPFICHRVLGHQGPHTDWSPTECLVPECACTEPTECAECGHLHWHEATRSYSTCPQSSDGCDCQGQAA